MVWAAFVMLWSSAALAEGAVFRVATAAPDGTTWTRELKAIGENVEQATNGGLRFKWYFGGIAGDEMEVAERMNKGQIDGVASGGPFCEKIAPSMRVLGIPGLFQSRDEAAYVMHVIRPALVDEALKAGYAMLITSGLGPTVIFSRTPIKNMAELRAKPLWDWDLYSPEIAAERAMGLKVNGSSVMTAARAYQTQAVDGFIAAPAAALAFQWSAQARYVTDLRTRYLTACIVISNHSFDKLPRAHQEAIREAFAKGDLRFEDLGRRMDDQLLGGLFAKQGLVSVPVSESFRAEFFEAARHARDRLGGQLVSPALLARALQMLSDYRAEHGTAQRN
jgi:TRAP-type C4-dicarboxylate transport system substrate-binding protein